MITNPILIEESRKPLFFIKRQFLKSDHSVHIVSLAMQPGDEICHAWTLKVKTVWALIPQRERGSCFRHGACICSAASVKTDRQPSFRSGSFSETLIQVLNNTNDQSFNGDMVDAQEEVFLLKNRDSDQWVSSDRDVVESVLHQWEGLI